MARDLAPKFKRSRREGIDLHPDLDKVGTAKSPLTRKAYHPGEHGPKGMRRKSSIYGKQLREKQKAKRIYGVLERQFRNYFRTALRQKGDTGYSMLKFLETRLDNTVYRLGFAKTRPAARQMVNHGQIQVNGKKLDIPSAHVSIGSEIQVKESIAKGAVYQETLKNIDRAIPSWLAKDSATKGKVVAEPDLEEPKTTMDVRQIIEFYSK